MNTNAKFVKVLQAILQYPEDIEDVERDGDEYYFEFRGHFLSVNYRSESGSGSAGVDLGQYSVFLYPKWKGPPKGLARVGAFPDQGELIAFHGEQISPRSQRHLFKQVYQTLQS